MSDRQKWLAVEVSEAAEGPDREAQSAETADVRALPEVAAIQERVARGLRASRDRRGERDAEIVRDLAVEGLQALDILAVELRRATSMLERVTAKRDDAWAAAERDRLRAVMRETAPLVYIAGPYTKPDPCINTHEAIKVANRVVDVCVPLIPHLSHFWHTMSPQPYTFWTEMDFVFLSRCDALLRFPGESPGADAEIVKAAEWGIPCFYDEAALRDWIVTR